jgi:serine/threonine-protein kinase
MVQTVRCVRCAADLPATAKYCPKCGAAAEAQLEATSDSYAATLDDPSPPARRNLLDTPALDEGRFVPGQILAERYRIVAMLGKGGMGEVYRADDLRLSQPVAMKFLPLSVSQDGAALARFHREVRLARQVSHPNVCRVFDIGETSGLPFLTMEYVDGEDLASLLRRIGRLPQDKAVEISRQLCAGLAAAHEAGVLHRDLKPANVMLDKRGKVRITDFGLAGLAGIGDDQIRAGTPAYMAPEQLAGKAATVSSDIYSLGLVLYEVFTGKRVFEASTLAELIRLRESTTPASPGELVAGLDLLIERVILRCLEAEPQRRPSSALQVAAALPGGDPLAAALAAGETPSPEMVAAAGGEGALSPKAAWAMLLATLAIAAAIVALAPYSTDLGLAPPRKSQVALEVRAQEIIERAGYTDPVADRTSWFERNYDFLFYRATHLPTAQANRELAHAGQSVLGFFYRQSPAAMAASGPGLRITAWDPPYEVSGMVTVYLGGDGRLYGFLAVPPQVEAASAAAPDPNWSDMLADSGIDPATLKSAQPTWLPPMGFDRRFGWRGFYREDPNTEMEISAASYRGKPVYFHVIGPWSRPWRMQALRLSRSSVIRESTLVAGGFLTLIMAAWFARRNIRIGRGDRRGAFRISAFVFSAAVISGLLTVHHVPSLGAEWEVVVRIISLALFIAAFVWLYYLALEPYVRRQMPELLVSWSRLLSGKFLDAIIGRDLLAGSLIGSATALGIHIANALPYWHDIPGETTIPTNPATLSSLRDAVGFLLATLLANGIFPAFAAMFTFFLVRLLLRNYWLSVAVTWMVFLLINLGGENFAVEMPIVILSTALALFALVRLGILAFAVAILVQNLWVNWPVTVDFSRWYSTHSLFTFAILLALLLYGFRVALGNKPLLLET